MRVAGSVSSDSDQLSKEWDESMGHMGQGEPEPVGCMSLLVPWPPIYTCYYATPHAPQTTRQDDNDHLISINTTRTFSCYLIFDVSGYVTFSGSPSRTLSLFLVGI